MARPRHLPKMKQPRRTRKTNRSELEELLAFHIKGVKVPIPEREYRFSGHHVGLGPGIRDRLVLAGLQDWRFDFAWPNYMLAVEVEGGAWVEGGHNRGKGFSDDLVKYHHAASLGWFLYRCDGDMIKRGLAIKFIEQRLGTKQ